MSYKRAILLLFFFVIFNNVSSQNYIINKIKFNNIDYEILKEINITKYYEKPAKNINLKFLLDQIIRYYENKGFPFAEIITDTLFSKENKINLFFEVRKHNKINIKNIYFKGESKIPRKYIKRYLSIKEGNTYNESKFLQISSKIKNLNFINQIRYPEVEFYKNYADVYLYLKPKKSNFFNGIIGFLPGKTDDEKLLITGDLKINLQNSFNKGESLMINWQKPENYSQNLSTSFLLPYFLGTPLGVKMSFSLVKTDTTYLTINYRPRLNYYSRNNDIFSIFYQGKKSMLLSEQYVDTSLYSNIDTKLLGVGYEIHKLDYKYNPSKGFSLYFDVATGIKNTNENISTQVEFSFTSEIYTRLYKQIILGVSTKNKYLFNKKLYNNELLKFGGINTLRGFDENEFLSPGYSILKLELRYLFEQNSNIYIFSDIGAYQKENIGQLPDTFLFSTGVGMNIRTGAGIFSLGYALGKQEDSPIKFSNSKIYVGYVNRF